MLNTKWYGTHINTENQAFNDDFVKENDLQYLSN